MILGITGSFGSGKTMVSDILKKYGFEIISADELYRGIYEKDTSLKNKIMKEFGTLDRSKIKTIVFNDYKKLKKLNQITHPVIIKEIKNKIDSIIEKIKNKKIIIKNKHIQKNKKKENNEEIKIALDVPLLIEAKMQGMVDKIIVVKCDEKIQIKRLLNKGKHTKEEIRNIINSQMPIGEKLKYADFVVDNSGKIGKTEGQIKDIVAKLSKL